jgi:methylenetetrahydrofolate reductase (NADPH)
MTSADASPASSTASSLDIVARVAAFARTASFETTHLTDAQLDDVKTAAPAGCAIYVSAIPARPLSEQIDTAKGLRAAGFEPVPHLAVRNFASVEAMQAHLRILVDQADVRRVLVIAGDRPDPAGSLYDALAAINSGVLQRCGIVEIGISGYPDGHPRIADADLERALAAKLAAAESNGLRVRIVTQFTMSTGPVVDLITRLRERGIHNPVSVGLAGPTSMKTLLRFASICGVKASTQGLARNIGLVKSLMGASTADPIVRALTDLAGQLGDINPHFFSFSGLPATTRWVGAVAAGHIKLGKEGFEVVQPKQ